ncbi:DUF2946 family protein [Paraherbaspirillum soli]|uniref:DUF2946 family protein n=1 Tax=Paraherbaspirillum soli TaxID=631222 RepID=A0ABW0M4E8_9BURK
MALFAVLLPSVARLLPAAHGQPPGLGDLCSAVGHRQAPDAGNPALPDQQHAGHCLLCFIHSADIGLPPGAAAWDIADSSSGRALPPPAITLPTAAAWLNPHPRGPPFFS